MADALNSSSSKVLQELFKQKPNGKIKAEALYQINKEVEHKLEEFDLQKKERMARAVHDLSMLVINA